MPRLHDGAREGSHCGNVAYVAGNESIEGMQMKSSGIASSLVIVASGVVLCGSAAMALEAKPTLTLALAKKMAAGCEAKAAQEKWAMNIAVVDDGANLV